MTIEERNQLVLDNQNLVHHVAHKFFIHPTAYYSYEDVVQEGMIGLIKAVDRFDPSKGYEFSSYAFPMIKGRIQRFFRENFGYYHYPRSAIEKFFKYIKDSREEGSEATIPTYMLESLNPIFLDSCIDNEDDKRYSNIISNSPDDLGTGDLEEIIENICESNFTCNQQDILYEYYFSKYFGSDVSQTDLGKKYNVSQPYVSRTLRKFEKLLEQYLYR